MKAQASHLAENTWEAKAFKCVSNGSYLSSVLTFVGPFSEVYYLLLM